MGFYIKRANSLAVIILLIIGGVLANLAVGEGPVSLSGYKPTYTQNDNYITPDPIQLGKFNGQRSTQLSSQGNEASQITASSTQVQVGFGIVGDSNEPIFGAQLTGHDGLSNSFEESTDGNGNVAVTGFPGNWQLTAYAPGYFSKTLSRQFTSNTYVALILQKIGNQQPIGAHGVTPIIIGNKNISACDLNETVELYSNLTTNQLSTDGPSTYDPLLQSEG